MTIDLHLGDCREVFRDAPLLDALVLDPPGGGSFMQLAFDSDRGGRDAWIAWLAERLADGRTARLRLEGTADPSKATNALDRLVATLPHEPPGKMRVTASVPVTYDVSPGQVAAYLRGEGWVRDPHSSLPGCGAAIASWTRADRHIVFAGLASDWAEHLVALLPRMAKEQGCSTGEVLRDIAAMEEVLVEP